MLWFAWLWLPPTWHISSEASHVFHHSTTWPPPRPPPSETLRAATVANYSAAPVLTGARRRASILDLPSTWRKLENLPPQPFPRTFTSPFSTYIIPYPPLLINILGSCLVLGLSSWLPVIVVCQSLAPCSRPSQAFEIIHLLKSLSPEITASTVTQAALQETFVH